MVFSFHSSINDIHTRTTSTAEEDGALVSLLLFSIIGAPDAKLSFYWAVETADRLGTFQNVLIDTGLPSLLAQDTADNSPKAEGSSALPKLSGENEFSGVGMTGNEDKRSTGLSS